MLCKTPHAGKTHRVAHSERFVTFDGAVVAVLGADKQHLAVM